MRVDTPFLSRSARGSLGKRLIYRRAGRGHTVYPHFKPKQPGTQAQQDHQALFALLAKRWRHFTLTQQDIWRPYTIVQDITLYNAYLRYNLQRLNPAATQGLIAWWPCISPAGQVLHDLMPGHYDGNFVSLNGNPTWVYDGQRRGLVLEYDGAGYIDVDPVPQVTGPFSCSAWFRHFSYVNMTSIIDTHLGTCYTFPYFWDGKLRFTVHGQGASSTTDVEFRRDWIHTAGTWTGTKLNTYVNGIWEADRNQTNAPEVQQMMWIGRRGVPAPHSPFHGRLDDIRLYNRVLTGDELLALAAR